MAPEPRCAGSKDEAFEALRDSVKRDGTLRARGAQITAEQLNCLLDVAPKDCARPSSDSGRGPPLLRNVELDGATIKGDAVFRGATFQGRASFANATFGGTAEFRAAAFHGNAHFDSATFAGDAHFSEATFHDKADFQKVTFEHAAHFPKTAFHCDVRFHEASLHKALAFGPMLVHGTLELDRASFGGVEIRVSAASVVCKRTQFHGPAHLKIRYAEVALDEAVFESASTLAFLRDWQDGREETQLATQLQDEHALRSDAPRRKRAAGTNPPDMPQLTSLSQADVGNLTLADVDLSRCLFAGALRLDELRFATECPFKKTPPGICFGRSFPFIWWWTKRISISEEGPWRATTAKWKGWADRCPIPRPDHHQEAERLAKIYRALRKGREDEKDAPGASDFYYGEMEMRRRGTDPPLQRGLISLYWLVSGYALRASRALLWLAATVVVFAGLFTLPGIRDPSYWDNLVFSLQSTTNLLRPPAETLGTEGQLLEIGLRLLGPLLFGLALLSLRGRVKR